MLGFREFRPKKSSTELGEPLRVSRGEKAVRPTGGGQTTEAGGLEDSTDVERCLFCRRNKECVTPHHVCDRAREERVVRTTEEESVDVVREQRR